MKPPTFKPMELKRKLVNKKKDDDKPKELTESKLQLLKMDATQIKNKIKRGEIYNEQKQLKKSIQKQERMKRKKAVENYKGDPDAPTAPKKLVPQTKESKREKDDTMVDENDEEILGEESIDEFSAYFNEHKTPKIMITTCRKPSQELLRLITDLLYALPNSYYYKRKNYMLKDITQWAINKDFTDLLVFHEHRSKPDGLIISHLPHGPTATFRLSNHKLASKISNRAQPDLSRPELILNNFNTRIGHRVGRMFTAMFPHDPEFEYRRVITFHNQRDFIFFRHHRYVFEKDRKEMKAHLQEIGPRFTLRLKSLQLGTFDTKYGEYEWFFKKEMDTSRTRFHL
eukprot:GEZU01042739.1.p1 GENE.GEZU01042739.1~~GEZU01042739.1.p1  ORF type:complete len:342 (-),score=97.42 GEZU01042739.1:264-1289(-)